MFLCLLSCDRYKIISELGEGTFGKVVKCEDLYKGRMIAIKIIKNVKKYREAAKLEINVLNKLAKYDPKVMIGPEKCQNGGCCGKIKRSGLKPVRPHVRLLRLPWAPVHRLRAPRFVKRMKTSKHLTNVFTGQSVFDFLKDNNYHPYPVEQVCDLPSLEYFLAVFWFYSNFDQVRQVAYELCLSVSFLHSVRKRIRQNGQIVDCSCMCEEICEI